MEETIEEIMEERMEEIMEANEVLKPRIFEETKEPSSEQKEPYHDNKWDLIYLRNTRNTLLELTDKYILPDYPITADNLEIIKTYRQELRNFINNNQEERLNGVIVELPKMPNL